jgi:hypothetical protein
MPTTTPTTAPFLSCSLYLKIEIYCLESPESGRGFLNFHFVYYSKIISEVFSFLPAGSWSLQPLLK